MHKERDTAQHFASRADGSEGPTGKKLQHGGASGTALVLLSVMTGRAWAALPTLQQPSQGASGGFMNQMQGYAYDAAIFLGLILACAAFFVVAKNTISAYSEVQDGKGTWGAVGVNFGAGAMLVVFIIWAMTKAAEVLSQATAP